jgi:hypothetical protein
MCPDCGAKWFIHEHRAGQPDLTECGRCGAPLEKLGGEGSSLSGWGPGPGEGAEPLGLDL